MTTVGYGDMSGSTLPEQYFCIALMLFGVLYFSFLSGSLASILSAIDQKNAELQGKIMFLKRLKEKYAIPNHIYKEINRFLNWSDKMTVEGLSEFIENLPTTLRIAVVMSIHRKTFKTHSFFKGLGNRRLLAFIGQRFK